LLRPRDATAVLQDATAALWDATAVLQDATAAPLKATAAALEATAALWDATAAPLKATAAALEATAAPRDATAAPLKATAAALEATAVLQDATAALFTTAVKRIDVKTSSTMQSGAGRSWCPGGAVVTGVTRIRSEHDTTNIATSQRLRGMLPPMQFYFHNRSDDIQVARVCCWTQSVQCTTRNRT